MKAEDQHGLVTLPLRGPKAVSILYTWLSGQPHESESRNAHGNPQLSSRNRGTGCSMERQEDTASPTPHRKLWLLPELPNQIS